MGPVEAHLALPGDLPAKLAGLAPASLHVRPAGGRLVWEQWTLPALARQAGANLIHLFSDSAPLLSTCPTLCMPCVPLPFAQAGGLTERARRSLAAGAAARGLSLLWPADLPLPAPTAHTAPPCVPGFFQPSLAEPPAPGGSYILCHAPAGASRADLDALAAVWSWAGPAIGIDTPLLVLGLAPPQQAHLREILAVEGQMDTIQFLPETDPWQIAALYRRARALLHPGPYSPWGDPLLLALACGLPIAAFETPHTSARSGPAGYLVPPGDTRALGAALVTLAVEDSVADALAEAARQRPALWGSERFGEALIEAYREVTKTGTWI